MDEYSPKGTGTQITGSNYINAGANGGTKNTVCHAAES